MQETSRQEPWLNEAVWHDAVFTGRWERLGQPTDVLEPATGQVISRIGLVGAEEISRSAARAREAQRAWAETHFEDRARVLRKAAELAEIHLADLAAWIVRDSGSVRAKAEFELGITDELLFCHVFAIHFCNDSSFWSVFKNHVDLCFRVFASACDDDTYGEYASTNNTHSTFSVHFLRVLS